VSVLSLQQVVNRADSGEEALAMQAHLCALGSKVCPVECSAACVGQGDRRGDKG